MASADFKIAREEAWDEEELAVEQHAGLGGGPPIDEPGSCSACKRTLNACHIDQPGSCTLEQIQAHYGRLERLQRSAR